MASLGGAPGEERAVRSLRLLLLLLRGALPVASSRPVVASAVCIRSSNPMLLSEKDASHMQRAGRSAGAGERTGKRPEGRKRRSASRSVRDHCDRSTRE